MSNVKLRKTVFGSNPRKFGAVTKKEENKYYTAEKEKKETPAAKKRYVEKRYKEEKSGTRNLDAPVIGRSFPAAYKKYKAERDAKNGKTEGGKVMKTGKMMPKNKDGTSGYAQGGNVQAKQKRYTHGGKVSAGSSNKQKRYAHGGIASAGSSKLMPTNQTTTKARGAGAATKGTNFKV